MKKKTGQTTSTKKIKTVRKSNLTVTDQESHTHTKDLIWIDEAPIRKKHLDEYNSNQNQLSKIKGEIEKYQSVDKPNYQSWVQANFAGIIQSIREKTTELLEKRSLVEEIKETAYIKNISLFSAYQMAIKRRAEEKKKKEKLKEEKTKEEQQYEYEKEREEKFREFYEEFHRFENVNNENNNEDNEEIEKKVKERYRLLAQKLHPDKNKNLTSAEKKLWLETVTAYKNKDLTRMDYLISAYNRDHGFISLEQTVFELIAANKLIQKELKNHKRTMNKAKKDPAWNFTKARDPKISKLKKGVKLEFAEYEKAIIREIFEFDKILRSWSVDRRVEKKTGYAYDLGIDDDFISLYINY